MRARPLFLQQVFRACRFTDVVTGDAFPPPPSRPLARSRFGFPHAEIRKRNSTLPPCLDKKWPRPYLQWNLDYIIAGAIVAYLKRSL